MSEFRTYNIVNCEELVSTLTPKQAASEKWIDDIDVSIPAVSYGQINLPSRSWWEWPHNNWQKASYALNSTKKYSFQDALVHGELGIITIGDYCIKESLHMVFPATHGFPVPSDGKISLPQREITTEIDQAFHALCGYVGNRNYAHWWVDIVPVLGYHLLDKRFHNATALLPQLRSSYQQQTLDLIPEIRDQASYLGEHDIAKVGCLQFVPSLTAGDYHPQPENIRFINSIKLQLGIAPQQRGERRLYLSRKDASTRRIINEDKLCEIAAQGGFEVITTTGMSLKEQITLFSQASHVVSPHGAGLANTLFCAPLSRMLELHCESSINWSLRRLASIKPLSYGCLLGRLEAEAPEETSQPDHSRDWLLDEAQFASVISSRPFA